MDTTTTTTLTYRVIRLGADGAPGMDNLKTLVRGLTLDEARQWIFDRCGTEDLPEWDAEGQYGEVEVYGEEHSDHAGGYAIHLDGEYDPYADLD